MAPKFGLDCKLYRLSTGTREAWPESGAPENLSEIKNVGDIPVPGEKDEQDATPRGASIEVVAAKLIKAPLRFTLKATGKTADAGHIAAFSTAFHTCVTIPLAVLDGASTTAGTQGWWADWEVLKFQRNEPSPESSGLVTYDVELKPGISDVDPEWVTVST